MTFLQLLRKILSAPMLLVFPPIHPENPEVHDFVHIAWFYGGIGILIWWMGEIGFGQ